ncbi:MAG: family serine peptidase, partial [Flavipsychrobacter sp.]|nr:family serine peptidase [Flavipsychrobacter sp.]
MRKYTYTLRHFFACLIACFLFHTVAGAQEIKTSNIYLKSGTITAEANAREWLQNISKTNPKEPVQVLVHFITLPTQEQRNTLQQSGITLMDYIPDNTYTALVSFPLNANGILAAQVYSIIDCKPEWKSSDYIWKTISGQNGTVRVMISFCPGIDPFVIKQYLISAGAKIESGSMERYGSYKVSINANRLSGIAQWYGVRYISPLTGMVPYDLQSRPAVKGNIAVAATSLGGYALTGDGVVVGVGDNASGIYHADLKDRITNFNPVPQANHGEHVNGIVGGAGSLDPLGQGMATHVSLIDFFYDQVLANTGAMFRDYHMTITNNSYGILLGDCTYSGTYDIYSNYLDTITVQYPDVLQIFASGNDGGMDCSPYPHGFATVGGGFQPAKNNVVVGSMTDLLFQAADESRGPVKDGRLKPEIVAVGLGAYSTVGTDEYEWAAGTSMASPQVAGGVALLTQRYKQLNGGNQPRADVLKTVLLNGAMDLGNPGPDYCFGFGSMDLSRSLQILDKNFYTTNDIKNGADQAFNITVPANTAQLKVMLYWNDIPASPVSSKQLVNDLDLTVTTPSSVTHLPLVLDATPSKVNNNATEQTDHLNNIEQVTINSPATGVYKVNTKGYNLPSGSVHYILAYDIIPQGVQLTYPIGGEQLSNVDTIRIFWNAITDGNKFNLQLSTDNGGNWSTLVSGIPADVRFFSFMPTGINSGNCLVRITRNAEVMTSARFAINTQPVIGLSGDQCPGYVNVHWSPVPNATSYVLYSKKGFYMQVAG